MLVCVYMYPCVFGRQYQAGSNQLSSEPLDDLARWRACLLPMTRMISLLRGEGHTHIHTYTWASYCAVSLICHVEGVTQTCMTHKHKQAVTNANMLHFTHGHIQMHSHTCMHAYELSTGTSYFYKHVQQQTLWIYHFVHFLNTTLCLGPLIFFI